MWISNCRLFFVIVLNVRMASCQQVLKGIMDKIEKEERASQRKQKQKEDAEERKLRAASNKLQGILFKHKEMLKKDILKKRALLEKDLQHQIQVRTISPPTWKTHRYVCHSSLEL